ncbi:MAG: hypothetical protein AB7O32_18010 [Vicinamibacterales bacterium]
MRGIGCAALLTLSVLAVTPAVRAQRQPPPAVEQTLDRISAHVAEYYSRAQSLVAREEVVEQPIRRDRSSDGISRQITYAIRFEWEPPLAGEAPAARMVREVTAIGGRAPRPKDRNRCEEPVAIQPEPLAMFLEGERESFEFKAAGVDRLDGVPVVRLDFRERPEQPRMTAKLELVKVGKEDCLITSTSGFPRGRVWVDAESGEVLRLDRYFIGPVEFELTDRERRELGVREPALDRWEETIRYRRVRFSDPEESLVLPHSIDIITLYRGGLVSTRRSQRFTEFRRFLAGGRIVE